MLLRKVKGWRIWKRRLQTKALSIFATWLAWPPTPGMRLKKRGLYPAVFVREIGEVQSV